MREIKGVAVSLLIVLGGGDALPCLGQLTPQRPQASVQLLRVGPLDVRPGQRITLEDVVTNVFGQAWGYRDQQFAAIVQPTGEDQICLVAGMATADPGG